MLKRLALMHDATSAGCACGCRIARQGLSVAFEPCPLHAAAEEMQKALGALLRRHQALVDSGDCGFWQVTDEEEYRAGIKALALSRGEAQS